MKKIVFVLLLSLLVLFGCVQQPETGPQVLRVYTYDSMASDYGLGPLVVPKFEEECSCKVEMVGAGDAGQVLSRLVLENGAGRQSADVVVGIDQSLAKKAIDAGVLEKFTPQNSGIVPKELLFDSDGYITPYDFGFIAFVYDRTKINPAPKNFEDLLEERFKGKILIQHPRTSSPGLSLLLWTVAVYGEDGYLEYWEKLKPNILTVTAGWDESAGLFATGEAPMYLSYATSPPYYVQFEENKNFLAAEFEEGHFMQIEGMAIVKGTKKRGLAEKFIEFSLTEKFQNEIPLTQFMFPVNESVELPQSFEYALFPKKTAALDQGLAEQKQEEWILEWEKIFS